MSKVLIVEDAPYVREVFRYALTAHDFEVAGEAVNGIEAIDKYRALRPDAVIMDLLMPVMDGLTAIRGIIEIDPRAKIVVVSAIGKSTIREDAFKAGAIDFVPKPFELDRLLKAVRAACS